MVIALDKALIRVNFNRASIRAALEWALVSKRVIRARKLASAKVNTSSSSRNQTTIADTVTEETKERLI